MEVQKKSDFKELKCAIGYNGKILFFEKFPDDEIHLGLDDFLSEIESESDFTEPPGVYIASFKFKYYDRDIAGNYDIESDSYLNVEKLTLVQLIGG